MNIDNLKKIRDHLQSVVLPNSVGNFDMSKFSDMSVSHMAKKKEVVEENFCGTSACVIGHASTIIPLRKSDVDRDPRDGELEVNWLKYCKRIFGIISSDEEWDFLFSGEWGEYVDGSEEQVREAIARLDYVIKYGDVPEGWDQDYEETYS